MRNSSTGPWLLVITAITILVVYIIFPFWPGGRHPGLFGRPLEVRPGLDIQGGLRVLMTAQSTAPIDAAKMDEVRRVIERRVNSLGLAEPTVQLAGNNRVIIELPGVSDPQSAINIVQQTALLEFVDFARTGACQAEFPVDGSYILTDRQVQGGLISAPISPTVTTGTAAPITLTATVIGSPTVVGTSDATLDATSAATFVATSAATAEAIATSAATDLATSASTAIPTGTATSETPIGLSDVSPIRGLRVARPAQTTPTAEVTPAATTQATQDATAAVTTEVTSAVTPEANQPATTEATAAATTDAAAAATSVATAESTAAATQVGTPQAATTPALPGQRGNPINNPCTGTPFRTIMTGAGLQTAEAGVNATGSTQWVVNFQLANNAEAQAFAAHTAANINQPMAIVVDGEVLSAPQIQAALTTGGVITGNFTRDEAQRLALQLRSGALPVSLSIDSIEQVGASLGQQSVNNAVRAGVLGVLVVFLFMLIFYRWAGLAAVLALLLFAGINFALYKFLPVTLTLSAITGFLISIATAVDGNVLIFERIKEELRAGRSMLKAIDIGFERAWPSIRESNLSTILIGLVLYFFGGQFGASTVRGFAVTTILGLLVNLFTAVFVTRQFLNLIVTLGGERMRQRKIFGG